VSGRRVEPTRLIGVRSSPAAVAVRDLGTRGLRARHVGMLRRAVFSESQRLQLAELFRRQKYVSKPERRRLADRLGLTDSQVRVASQNVAFRPQAFSYSTPSVGPGADPGVQAVTLQVTVSHPPGGRLPLLSARRAVTSPAAEHHRRLAGTKLYCLVTEAHRCKQLA